MADKVQKVRLTPAKCHVDIGDGSERGPYVTPGYMLEKLGRPMHAVTLMYSYYPLDKGWPLRARDAFPEMTKDLDSAWGYPYDDYFPYMRGLGGDPKGEPYDIMRDVRMHGQDVCLTVTVDPFLPEEYMRAFAAELRPFGRMTLRINHEATGNWFSFNKRASYARVAEFFAEFTKIVHEEASNVETVICLDGYKSEDTEKMEREDDFIPAIQAADIVSVDRYLALHWGWPYDMDMTEGRAFARYDPAQIYRLCKKSAARYNLICGKKKKMILSELNADALVVGPYEQAEIVRSFTDMIREEKDPWLTGFCLYQFRDECHLGLEAQVPGDESAGIEQPLMKTFKEIISDPFFSPAIVKDGETSLPAALRWTGSDDAEGVEIQLHLDSDPVFLEAKFETPELKAMNLMIELGGKWFHKAPGADTIDLMGAFFEGKVRASGDLKVRLFAPPQDGLNHPAGDDLLNEYVTLPALPTFRILYQPIALG